MLKIAVGTDKLLWHEKFSEVLAKKVQQGYELEYDVLNLDKQDWAEAIEPYDVVLWKPAFMGVRSASYFKEKIYFMEKHLAKLVVPNFDTVWHFESKVAQSYMFRHCGIKTPQTVASFSHTDAIEQAENVKMPLVFKESHGASSQNVQLVRNRRIAHRKIDKTFCQELWDDAKERNTSTVRRTLSAMSKPWFWWKIQQKLGGRERFGVAYWQEFIPENESDLRITVIGDRYAVGFWRNNRPHDFRASGSGSIDYERQIPEGPLRYCLNLNKDFNFDSMAYDIVFTQDSFAVIEMSYAYLDAAVYGASGHYEIDESDTLAFRKGHTWPQELWVEWALRRVGCKSVSRA